MQYWNWHVKVNLYKYLCGLITDNLHSINLLYMNIWIHII